MQVPELSQGEQYAGIVLDADGHPTHHLSLLPQQPDSRLTWDAAMEWASSQGAELPTQQEQALLYANLKHAFDPDWYWSGERYAGNASNAWIQYFANGSQYNTGKGYQGRVRAVRRIVISDPACWMRSQADAIAKTTGASK